MSKSVSVLKGASYNAGIADVQEIGLQGMITLRGDLSDARVVKAAQDATGTQMPGQRCGTLKGDKGLCWMSPDELLLLCPYAEVAQVLAGLSEALQGVHSLAVNVSDARASFRVSAPNAREVLAKLAPVDLAPGHFTQGMFRRTRLAQTPAAFWLSDADSFQIICFRSNAQYLFDLLMVAAQPGSEVGLFG